MNIQPESLKESYSGDGSNHRPLVGEKDSIVSERSVNFSTLVGKFEGRRNSADSSKGTVISDNSGDVKEKVPKADLEIVKKHVKPSTDPFTSGGKHKAIEVDFYRNPTILSRLILHQKYSSAIQVSSKNVTCTFLASFCSSDRRDCIKIPKKLRSGCARSANLALVRVAKTFLTTYVSYQFILQSGTSIGFLRQRRQRKF